MENMKQSSLLWFLLGSIIQGAYSQYCTSTFDCGASETCCSDNLCCGFDDVVQTTANVAVGVIVAIVVSVILCIAGCITACICCARQRSRPTQTIVTTTAMQPQPNIAIPPTQPHHYPPQQGYAPPQPYTPQQGAYPQQGYPQPYPPQGSYHQGFAPAPQSDNLVANPPPVNPGYGVNTPYPPQEKGGYPHEPPPYSG